MALALTILNRIAHILPRYYLVWDADMKATRLYTRAYLERNRLREPMSEADELANIMVDFSPPVKAQAE